MTIVFALGKPAARSPVIAAAIDALRHKGVPVRSVVPQATDDDGAWLVDGQVRQVHADLGEARLIAQRGLDRQMLELLVPWAHRCCNDPVATARTHHRADLAGALARAGLTVPRARVLDDYQAARATGQVIKSLDARVGRGAGVLMPGLTPPAAPFDGPYLVQEHLDGWEAKLYVFGAQVRALRRPAGQHRGGQVHDLDDGLRQVARAAAQASGLHLCGVDVMVTADGPVVIDVNAFPSATKIPQAADLIAAHLAAHEQEAR